MTSEGSAELTAPHEEGEYVVGIMLNGIGFSGRNNYWFYLYWKLINLSVSGLKVKTVPLLVDTKAPDPVVETPAVQQAPIVLAVNNNNNAGGHSQQLLEFASMKTEFASWKDFFVHAGVNNAEMYGQVATAINMPVSLIPVGT